jgi:hypothetical protein
MVLDLRKKTKLTECYVLSPRNATCPKKYYKINKKKTKLKKKKIGGGQNFQFFFLMFMFFIFF